MAQQKQQLRSQGSSIPTYASVLSQALVKRATYKQPIAKEDKHDKKYDKRFQLVAQGIEECMAEKMARQPKTNQRWAFDQYWQHIFARLARDFRLSDTRHTTSRSTLPKMLRLPCGGKLDVRICEEPSTPEAYLRMLDDTNDLPRFEIEAEEGKGVSRELFVTELGRALYGPYEFVGRRSPPKRVIGRWEDLLVVDRIIWQTRGVNDKHFKPVYVIVHGFSPPTVEGEEPENQNKKVDEEPEEKTESKEEAVLGNSDAEETPGVQATAMPESNGNDENDEHEDDDENDNHGSDDNDHNNDDDHEKEDNEDNTKFDDFMSVLKMIFSRAKNDQPAVSEPREVWDQYWRGVFRDIPTILASRPDLPDWSELPDFVRFPGQAAMVVYLVKRPEPLSRYLYNWNDSHCFELTRNKSRGISKELFLGRLCRALYGNDMGRGRKVGTEKDRLTVDMMRLHSKDWRNSPVFIGLGGIHGEEPLIRRFGGQEDWLEQYFEEYEWEAHELKRCGLDEDAIFMYRKSGVSQRRRRL